MPSTTGGVTLFTPEYPIVIRMADLYNPLVTPATGRVIPVLDCLVVDDNYNIWIVVAVDPVTHASTLRPARMFVDNTNAQDDLVSVVSYGNDIFRIYFDPRTNPVDVRPDARLVIFGADVVSYQLVQNPGPSQVVISRNYDASGNYTGVLVPMIKVPTPGADGGLILSPAANSPAPCHTQTILTDGEAITLQAFNSQGAQVAQVSAFAKESIIINEAIYPEPIITGVAIIGSQMRSNNEIYIYQNQSVGSLGLQVVLTYSSGYTRSVPIDHTQCFLYGIEDFIPSYPGLQQTLLAKYYLNSNEVMSMALTTQSREFVSAEINLVVIANGLQAGVKISVIPIWNTHTNGYTLSYFLYSTTRNQVINVTSLVTISSSSHYNPSLFGQPQTLRLQLDMSRAEPTIYTIQTIYSQVCVITLQPLSVTDRYVLKDASNAPIVFGATSTTLNRPAIHYDSLRMQYYIPTTLFPTQTLMLEAFFINASPPYDTTNETQVPMPTHFQLRDPSSGVLLTAAPISVTSYAMAVSIVGAGLPNRYATTGSNMIVEFLAIIGTTRLILYGVPVDVSPGVYSS